MNLTYPQIHWPLRQCLKWSTAQPGIRPISARYVDSKSAGSSEVY